MINLRVKLRLGGGLYFRLGLRGEFRNCYRLCEGLRFVTWLLWLIFRLIKTTVPLSKAVRDFKLVSLFVLIFNLRAS